MHESIKKLRFRRLDFFKVQDLISENNLQNKTIQNIQFDLDSSGLNTKSTQTIKECLRSFFKSTPIDLKTRILCILKVQRMEQIFVGLFLVVLPHCAGNL